MLRKGNIKMEKTLYITDLDGTLMKDDKTISERTITVINSLVKHGVLVTYATARSINSASVITKDINLQLPVITLNGTIIADQKTGRKDIEMFAKQDLEEIKKCIKDFKIPANITSYTGGREKKLYIKGLINEGFKNWLDSHAGDKSLMAVNTEEELFSGEICYITFIADKKELDPLYMRIKNSVRCICNYDMDKYRSEYWLELSPLSATKAEAARKLKERYGCGRLIVFGDSLNDIPMFEIADEAYATANANKILKAKATGIIGSNNNDGVARWLSTNVKI